MPRIVSLQRLREVDVEIRVRAPCPGRARRNEGCALPVVVDIHCMGVGAHDLRHSVRERLRRRVIFAEHPGTPPDNPLAARHEGARPVRARPGKSVAKRQSNACASPARGFAVSLVITTNSQIGIRQLLDDEQKNRGLPPPQIGAHNLTTSSSLARNASMRHGCFGLRRTASGNQRSMMTPADYSGKNCSGTWARVATPTPNNATVPMMTVLRCSTHASTQRRKRL